MFFQHLKQFQDHSKSLSDTFAFWNEFIEMVLILLRFVRAERDGIWELHIDSLSEMLPYFFAYDISNYAHWASVYIADMKAFEVTAKYVYDEFVQRIIQSGLD